MKKFLEKAKLTVKVLEWVVTGILVSLLLVSFSPYLPTKDHISSYVVTSGSMEPSIPTGSVAFVRKSNGLSAGDVIAFSSPTQASVTILHRIHEVKSDGPSRSYITKGDNNDAIDNWTIPESTIKGKFLFSIPYIGYTESLIRTPLGFFVIIGLPLSFLAWKNIQMIFGGIQEEKEKRKRSTPPLAAGLLIILGFLLVQLLKIDNINAQFKSQAFISDIHITTYSGPNPSPTPLPTQIPTPTPTIGTSPTPTPTPSSGTVIIISGNGDGSTVVVDVANTNTTTVTQSSSTTVVTSSTSTSNTGGNTIENNTNSASLIETSQGQSTNSVSVTSSSLTLVE